MTIEEAIKQRHSVRKYIHKPLSTEAVRVLEEKIGECNKEGTLHIQLVTHYFHRLKDRLLCRY